MEVKPKERFINCPCPKCGCSSVFYLGEGYLKSEADPVLTPPFAYCENCGFEDDNGKKYYKFLEPVTKNVFKEG